MLSKNSKTLLKSLLKEYKRRIDNGYSSIDAIAFGSASKIQKELFPKWNIANVESSLRELGQNKYLNNFYADNTIAECLLSDNAISEKDSQKQRRFFKFLDFLFKFKP